MDQYIKDLYEKPSGEQEKVLYLVHHLKNDSTASIAEFIKNKTGKVPGLIKHENPGVYIWFPSKEDNEMAQSKLDGLKGKGGKTVKCVWTKRMSRIPARLCWNTSECIRITGMKANTTRQQIADFIKQKGKMTINDEAISLVKPFASDAPRMSAAIRCGSNKNAQQLVKKLNLKEMNGNKVWIEILVDLKGKTKYLKITNLKDDVTEQDVANLLQKSGKIKNAPKSIKLITSKVVGVRCMITFETIEEADRAYDVLSSSKLKGRDIVVFRWKRINGHQQKRTRKQKKEMKTALRKDAKGKSKAISGKALKEMKKTKDVKMKKKTSKNKGKQKLDGKKKKSKGVTNAKAAKGKKAKGKKTKGKSVKV